MGLQVVSTPFKFVVEGGEFLRLSRAAVHDAKLEVGGTMLADMLVGRAVVAQGVGGQFREEGEDAALLVHAEHSDCRVHWLGLLKYMTARGMVEGEEIYLAHAAFP